MNNKEVKDWVDYAFNRIKQANSLEDLHLIENSIGLADKNKMSTQSYPPINFSLTAEEISCLQQKGVLTNTHEISPDFANSQQDPIAKLLYALIWKNGDLKKIRHIVAGILNEKGKGKEEKQQGLVFYQFGKFLTRALGEPIIDQHVLRAFGIYQAAASDEKEISRLRKLSLITKNDKALIEDYKTWLQSEDGLQECLRRTKGYTVHLDRLLFAIGKTAKINKRNASILVPVPSSLPH